MRPTAKSRHFSPCHRLRLSRIAVFAVFAALLVLGMLFHEMWRDEIQAWLIVRDSHSVADLFRNLRYEGHPALWYVLLAPFSLFSTQPEWMQVLQGAVALSSVWLILWRMRAASACWRTCTSFMRWLEWRPP